MVGFLHSNKGQGIYEYIILDRLAEGTDQMIDEIFETIIEYIGRITKPDKIHFVSGLPKTLSGKIMRRILRKVKVSEVSPIRETSLCLTRW